jgi:hypothetical protein
MITNAEVERFGRRRLGVIMAYFKKEEDFRTVHAAPETRSNHLQKLHL